MKKKFLIFLSAMMMLSSMTGCSGTGKVNNETTSQNQQTTTVAESSQQETKQEMTAAQTETSEPTVVRMSLGSEPDSLDPWQSAASDTEAIFHNVFEGLLVYDSTGALVPGIAESYEISDDGLTYTFKIRDDITFHNGKKLTSADVLYTYNHLAGMNGEKAVSSKFASVVSIDAPDEYTFVLTLSEPSASFLAFNIIAVLPEGYDEQETSPVGTGPYKFVEYVAGQRVVFEKNEDYYEETRAGKVDRVEVYIMTDASAIVAALMSDQLDLAGVSKENAALLGDEFDLYASPQNMVQVFALNNTYEPFSDVKVRQAFNYVIDKQEIIAGAHGGNATELYSNFSPVMDVYYNDELSDVYTVDIEKAKELMKEAGYENGFDLTIKVPGNYTTHVNTAEIIAQQLEQINVNVEIETIEWATWLEDVYANAQYEGTVIGLTGKLDPNDVLARYTSTYAKNFYKYANEEYDKLIAQAAVELDNDKRVELYKECQKILTEDAAAIFICDPNSTMAAKNNLKGYTFYPVTFHDFTKLYYEN